MFTTGYTQTLKTDQWLSMKLKNQYTLVCENPAEKEMTNQLFKSIH